MTTALMHKATKLNAIYGSGRAAAVPATWYLAGYEVAPDENGQGGTQMTYPGYARIAVANTDANFPALVAPDAMKTLVVRVDWPLPPVDTNPLVAVALHGHPTNDDAWDWEYLPDPVSALAGKALYVPAGTLRFTIP